MSVRTATWSILAAVLCCWTSPALSGPWVPAPGDFHAELQAGLFSTGTYFNNSGRRVGLAFGGFEETRSILSYNEIGWKKNTSFILGIPVSSVTRRSDAGEVNRTDTGVSDIQLGLRIKMAEGPSAAAFEVDWYAPAGYNRKYLLTSDTLAFADASECKGLTGADSINCVRQLAPPRLGSGQQEFAAAIHWGASLKRWNAFIQLSQGYRNRGTLAAQALFSADLGFWVGRSLLVAGRYRGAIDVGRGQTLADDVEEHLAGPVFVYRLDDGMDVFASSLHTAVARNALHADRFYIGVAFKKTGLDRLQGYLGGTRDPLTKGK